MHWGCKYIGLPYEPAARGPEKVDCWGLVYLAYREVFGLELPLYPGISLAKPVECSDTIRKALAEEWAIVPKPFDGCMVGMSQRHEIHHVALYAEVDSGRVLHCYNSGQVVADTLRGLRFRGMRIIKFYRYKLWPTS